MWTSGADPGFPVGMGADPVGRGGGGHQHMILSTFPKNRMKSRKFWALGGGGVCGGEPPLDSPLNVINCGKLQNNFRTNSVLLSRPFSDLLLEYLHSSH